MRSRINFFHTFQIDCSRIQTSFRILKLIVWELSGNFAPGRVSHPLLGEAKSWQLWKGCQLYQLVLSIFFTTLFSKLSGFLPFISQFLDSAQTWHIWRAKNVTFMIFAKMRSGWPWGVPPTFWSAFRDFLGVCKNRCFFIQKHCFTPFLMYLYLRMSGDLSSASQGLPQQTCQENPSHRFASWSSLRLVW